MISIILPFHEEQPFLFPAIRSALSQRCGAVELICVNDGAPEQIVACVVDLLGGRPNTSVVSCVGAGLSAARNTGIQAAHGEYLVFLDSDDLLPADALCNLSQIVRDGDIDVVYFSAKARFETFLEFMRNPHYLLAYRRESLGTRAIPGETYLALQLLRGEWIPSACLQLISRKMIRDRGIRFREGVLMEDHEFSVTVALAARRVSATRLPLYVRTVRRGSITTSSRSLERSEGYSIAMSAVRELAVIHADRGELERALGAYATSLEKLSLRERSRDYSAPGRSAKTLDKITTLTFLNRVLPPFHSWLRFARLSIKYFMRRLIHSHRGLLEEAESEPRA